MEVIFEYDNVKSSNRLETKSLQKLNKLSTKYPFIVRGSVFFKTERTQNPETGRICAIKLSVPGPLLFAEHNCADFESALLEVIHELEAQLAKKKGKMIAH